MEMEEIPFIEAAKKLAIRAHVPLPTSNWKEKQGSGNEERASMIGMTVVVMAYATFFKSAGFS